MKWKKFKKEQISLNYTVMLLPHSQKKPIHFKTPVWTFGLFFLGLLVLSGACLFFAGSRLQLKEVQAEKAKLEQEWEELAQEKELADLENEMLKQARETQEQELKELEQRTRDTLKELEDLVVRESQIRQELGLGQAEGGEDGQALPGEDEGTGDSSAPESGEGEKTEDDWDPESLEDGDAEGEASGQVLSPAAMYAQYGAVEASGTSSVEYTMMLAENDASFQVIQSELALLSSTLTEKTSQYDAYLATIEERKAAEAAEIARRKALRDSIVQTALQYVGNAYVYGGNDPNTGVDCSGFTRYILGNVAGVYLNRTAAAQSGQGRQVSEAEARPGDLVFYSGGGGVNHVAIYMGNGRVVHASNERVGITTSDIHYRTPVKIMNVLGD